MRRGIFETLNPFIPTVILLVGWLVQPFGWPGEMLFFAASLIALAGGIAYLHATWNKKSTIHEAEQLKQVFSIQRHDWMNHIQVLMGYLMMKKAERIKGYIQNLVEQAQQERRASEFRYAPLATCLLMLKHRLKNCEIDLKLDDPISLPDIKDEKRLLKMIEFVFPWLEHKLKQEQAFCRLTLSLSKREQSVFVVTEVVEEQDKPVMFYSYSKDWMELKKKIRKINGNIGLLPGGRGITIECQLTQKG